MTAIFVLPKPFGLILCRMLSSGAPFKNLSKFLLVFRLDLLKIRKITFGDSVRKTWGNLPGVTTTILVWAVSTVIFTIQCRHCYTRQKLCTLTIAPKPIQNHTRALKMLRKLTDSGPIVGLRGFEGHSSPSYDPTGHPSPPTSLLTWHLIPVHLSGCWRTKSDVWRSWSS